MIMNDAAGKCQSPYYVHIIWSSLRYLAPIFFWEVLNSTIMCIVMLLNEDGRIDLEITKTNCYN